MDQRLTYISQALVSGGAIVAHAPASHRCGPDGCDHASSCAVHNGPALPNGPCDCGYDES